MLAIVWRTEFLVFKNEGYCRPKYLRSGLRPRKSGTKSDPLGEPTDPPTLNDKIDTQNFIQSSPPIQLIDNQSDIYFSLHTGKTKRRKHIDVKDNHICNRTKEDTDFLWWDRPNETNSRNIQPLRRLHQIPPTPELQHPYEIIHHRSHPVTH